MRTSPPRASASPRPKSTPSPLSRPRKAEADRADAQRRCGTGPDPTSSRMHGHPTKEHTMLSNHRSRGALITSAAVPATLASTVAPIAAGQNAHAVARRQRWTLGVVCAATALLLFNVTAPIVALPSVAADLRLSFTSQQCVLSSYALVLASLLLAGGALGDRFGRRRLFLTGLGVFAAG